MLRQKSIFAITLLILLNSMLLLTLINVNSPKNQASLKNDLEKLPLNSDEAGFNPLLIWNTTWGGQYWDCGYGVAVDATGAIYCAGYTSSSGTGVSDLLLLKFNANGTKAWQTIWGGQYYDCGYGVAVDATGAIYCVGYTSSFGAGSYDLLLLKFSATGTKAWQTTWGGSGTDYGYGVAVDATGAIYCVGETGSFGAGGADLALVKFYANGTKAWNTTWSGLYNDYGYGVAVDATGAIYCVGCTSSFGAGSSDLVLLKFFSNGTKAWNTTWGGSNSDYGYGVAVDAIGAIYCVGYTLSFGAGSSDLVLLKFNTDGTKVWQTTWGGSNSDYGRDVVVDATGAIYCVGYTYSFGVGIYDLVLIRFNTDGKKVWQITWGGSNTDYGRGVAMDVTGAIYCVGYTLSFGAGSSDLVLLKFCQPTASLNKLLLERITPNPDSDGLIELNWNDIANASLYYIYRSYSNITSVSGMVPIASVTQIAYQDSIAFNGIYFYAIYAIDLIGVKASISNCEAVKVLIYPYPSLLWNTTWGGSNADYGQGVAVDATGAIYCLGYTYSFGVGSADFLLVKFNANGMKAWTTTWGGSSNDFGSAVAVDATGAIYCVGETGSFGAGGADLALVKFYANGTKAWTTTWGGLKSEKGCGVAVDITGAIYCVGYTSSFGAGNADLALVKFYANGTKAWYNTWGGSNTDYGYGVAVDATGAIYCVGYTNSFGAGSSDLVLLKFNTDGTKVWQTTWGGSNTDYGYGVAVDATGAIYCVGYTYSFGAGGTDLVLLKFFSNGTKAWQTTWGGISSDGGYGVAVDATGAIYCVGYTSSSGTGGADLLLVTFFSNGTKAGQTTWGGSNSDYGRGVAMDAIGAIYCVGYTSSFGAGSSDLGLIKYFQPLTPLNKPLLDPISPNPNSDGLIELNWNEVTGASRYYIFRSTSNISFLEGMVPIATVTQSTYQDRIVSNGTYYYVIIASNPAGNSSISNCEAVTVSMPINSHAPEFGQRYAIVYRYSTSSLWDIHAIYKDLDNDPPTYVNVTINGTAYQMNKVTPSDVNYMDGCEYQYSIYLTRGNYIFIFECSDGRYRNSTKPFKYYPPILSDYAVSPSMGSPTTQFTFITRYTSLTNYTPQYVTLIINGTWYSMTKQNSSDLNYMDGCVYHYQTILPIGTYLYSFECSDGIYVTSTNSFQLNVINPFNPPSLNAITPNPDSDGLITLSWSTVPGAVKYYIYRSPAPITSVIGMRPIGRVNLPNYIDTLTINGTYYYVVVAGSLTENSSISNCQSTRVAIPPTNFYAPTLLSGGIKPRIGTHFTNFTFTVIYQDQDNNSPVLMNITINGISYAMRKQNPSDYCYTDGCLFQYTTCLPPGLYNYSFIGYDGKFFNQPAVTYLGLIVYDATIASITNFTLFNPLTIIQDTTPDIICQISVRGAGINLSSVQYAYSTVGNAAPTNWARVDGIYLDAACTVSACNGSTGILYLKISAVPFNQYSSTDNIIRFRAADMAGNQLVQSSPMSIKIENEPPHANSIIFILLIVGASVVGLYSSYTVVCKRKKEYQIKAVLIKVLSISDTFPPSCQLIEEYSDYMNDLNESTVQTSIDALEFSLEELAKSDEAVDTNLRTNLAPLNYLKLFKGFHRMLKAFPSLNQYFPQTELLSFLMDLKSLSDEEIFAYISILLEKVSVSELRPQIVALMNELKEAEEYKTWDPILGKIDQLIYLAESRNDQVLLKDLLQLLIFIEDFSDGPIKVSAEFPLPLRIQTPVEVPEESIVDRPEPMSDGILETFSDAVQITQQCEGSIDLPIEVPVELYDRHYIEKVPESEILCQSSVVLYKLKSSTDNRYQIFLYNKIGTLIDMAIALNDRTFLTELFQLLILIENS